MKISCYIPFATNRAGQQVKAGAGRQAQPQHPGQLFPAGEPALRQRVHRHPHHRLRLREAEDHVRRGEDQLCDPAPTPAQPGAREQVPYTYFCYYS